LLLDHVITTTSMSQPHFIAIRTCDRPGYLQRELLSLSRRQAENSICALIFDDSRDAAVQQRNQQIVESAQRRFGRDSAFSTRYLGQVWQAGFIARLKAELPELADSIDWLLAPRPAGTFSGGRLLNLIMLALAGQRFSLFDDDYLLDRARHLGDGDSRRLDWSSDPPINLLAHRSVRESRAAGIEFERDPIEAQLEFLGRRVQDCLQSADGASIPLLDASQAGIPSERLLLDSDSVFLTTVSGQYGVPISPDYFYLLNQPAGPDGPVWADPEQYQLMRDGKAIWNVTHSPVIADRTGSTPTGVDNRQLMPPTLPDCRGEDTLYCALLKYLHPNSVTIYLPWALEHSRQSRPWADATFELPPKPGVAKTFWKVVEGFIGFKDMPGTVDGRLNFLAQHWQNWAIQPYAELREQIQKSCLRSLRWRLKVMTECLEQVPDSRLQVHRDLRRGIQQINSAMDMRAGLPGLENHPAIQGELQSIEWLASVGKDFGSALGAWSRLWHTARTMQAIASSHSIGQKVERRQ